jgi:hypothetical protein
VGKVRRSVVIGLVAAAALGLVDSAAAGVWKRHDVPRAGFSVEVPATWQIVPRSVSSVQALIRRLRSQGRVSVARQYQALIDDPYARDNLRQSFQAFAWPALPSSVRTDVVIGTHTLTKAQAALGDGLLDGFAAGLARQIGSRDVRVRKLRLPAGAAREITGTVTLDRSYGGAKSAVTVYAILHRRRLLIVNCRTDARYNRRYGPMFGHIARSIRI